MSYAPLPPAGGPFSPPPMLSLACGRRESPALTAICHPWGGHGTKFNLGAPRGWHACCQQQGPAADAVPVAAGAGLPPQLAF